MMLKIFPATLTLLWVCLTVVPGKLDVSTFKPAIALKRALFPELGWPRKMMSGRLLFVANYLYHYVSGNPSAQGHGRVGGQTSYKNRPSEYAA